MGLFRKHASEVFEALMINGKLDIIATKDPDTHEFKIAINDRQILDCTETEGKIVFVALSKLLNKKDQKELRRLSFKGCNEQRK